MTDASPEKTETLASAFLSLVNSEADVMIVPCAVDDEPGMENLSYEITLENGVLMNRVTAFDPDSGDIVMQGKTSIRASITPDGLRNLAARDGATIRQAYSYQTWEHAAA